MARPHEPGVERVRARLSRAITGIAIARAVVARALLCAEGMSSAPSNLLRRLSLLTFLAAAPTFGAGCIVSTEDADTEYADDADEIGDSADEAAEETDTLEEGLAGKTVAAVVSASCSTTSVNGLSKQIIAEARCTNPDAYAEVPKLSNVTFGSAVYRYLEKPARDKLVATLNAHPGTTMTINSMLRTVAQQYLLYRWYQSGTCSISLAATPGNSNHETGIALDVSQYNTWKSYLQANGFQWLGSSDAVHFDYVGAGAVSYKGLDVKAFQRLWNRNHPGDLIAADGIWGPQTEARMKVTPSDGFPVGAQCVQAREVDAPAEALADDSFGLAPTAETTQGVESVNAELIEELRLQHEQESCGDHAH